MPCRGKTFSVDHSAPFSQAVRLPLWDWTGHLSEGPLPGFGLVMCRTVKPKLRVCPDTQSCAGVQTQTSSTSVGVSDSHLWSAPPSFSRLFCFGWRYRGLAALSPMAAMGRRCGRRRGEMNGGEVGRLWDPTRVAAWAGEDHLDLHQVIESAGSHGDGEDS